MHTTQFLRCGFLLSLAACGCNRRAQPTRSTEDSCSAAYTEHNQFVTSTTQDILGMLDAGTAAGPVAPLSRERFMAACRRLPPEAAQCASTSYDIVHQDECRPYESQTLHLWDP